MKNVLAVALVVLVASVALSQAPPSGRVDTSSFGPAAAPDPAAPAFPEHPQKWEYKVRDLGTGGGREAAKSIEAIFNDVAKEGYELELIFADRMAIFRRPVQQRIGDPLMKDLLKHVEAERLDAIDEKEL